MNNLKNNVFQFIFYLIRINNLFVLKYNSNNLYFLFLFKINNEENYNQINKNKFFETKIILRKIKCITVIQFIFIYQILIYWKYNMNDQIKLFDVFKEIISIVILLMEQIFHKYLIIITRTKINSEKIYFIVYIIHIFQINIIQKLKRNKFDKRNNI